MPIDLEPIAEIERRIAINEARADRLEALARKGRRRRATRSRIILGGAIIAEIRDNPDDTAFLQRIVSLLDDRVSRGRDRDDLRELLDLPLPIAPSENTAPSPSAELPDFDAMAETVMRVPRSIADTDPAFADVRALIKKPS